MAVGTGRESLVVIFYITARGAADLHTAAEVSMSTLNVSQFASFQDWDYKLSWANVQDTGSEMQQ